MHRKLRLLMLTVGIPALLVGLAAPATADPSRAPNLIFGQASCGEAGLFTFIATQSNSESITWSPAFFTRVEDGATGLFIPASFDVVVTTDPDGTNFSFSATKGTAPGPVSCHFKARGEGGLPAIFGDMTGKLILTG